MKRIMKPLKRSYFLIVLMAVVCSACLGPEAKENALVSSLSEKSGYDNPTAVQDVAAAPVNLILQSKDGGQTWQDISDGLPENVQPEGFFAGESDVYVHLNNVLYHSMGNLQTPVWEKEHVPDLKSRSSRGQASTLIAFNASGVMAYNSDGQIYQKTSASETWVPVFTNFKRQALRSVLETADGTLFLGYDQGLYKSADKGKNWKQVHTGPVYAVVESAGVLLATRGTAIMRSTDNGEHWEWIINEGRVGHGIEAIEGGFVAVTDGGPTKPRTIRVSKDKGETWNAIDEGLPPSFSISSIKQMGRYLICSHPDGIFRSADMGKTWTRVYPAGASAEAKKFMKVSYSAQRVNVSKTVFTLYTSGNTVYAVAKVAGC
jgi:photosystem II stability/assembly factor-like uncharacterized protein